MRNDIQISTEILNIAKSGALKTHLVYKANLNFQIIKKYLRNLITSGLLEKVGDRYITTEKGLRWAMLFEGMNQLTKIRW